MSYLVTTYLCWGAGALMLWVCGGGDSGGRGGARENSRQGKGPGEGRTRREAAL